LISSAVWIQCTNVTDRQTDGHRATAKTALTHSVAPRRLFGREFQTVGPATAKAIRAETVTRFDQKTSTG